MNLFLRIYLIKALLIKIDLESLVRATGFEPAPPTTPL